MVLPDWLMEVETTTAMYDGTLEGGPELLPGCVVQVWPHAGIVRLLSKPLNAAGAVPPLSPFNFHHCEPQNVTSVPTAA
jgi:hypothetical protein